MANNYTQFSFAFTVKGLKAKAWIDRMVDKLSQATGDGTDDEEILELFPDWSFYQDCGFRTEMESVPGKKNQWGLWIYAEESGNPDAAADFVQAILKRFDPKSKVGFEFASFCDKPRVGEFGGGACVVTAKKQKWTNTGTWLSKELSK